MKNFILLVFAIIFASCTTTKPSTSVTPTPPTTWDISYGGADKSYDTQLLKLREEIAPKFKVLTFQDKETGKSMEYNLYIPKSYNPKKQYPLVLFMADASTVGKGVAAPLKQGYGGIIWATDESQKENPCFILVPSYKGPERATNDDWQVSDEVGITYRLLHEILNQYSINQNQLYTTGQSMGGMISFYFNAKYPDLFAASIFVGSQWNVNELSSLAHKKFFYIVSAADPKASEGMKQLGNMFQQKDIKYGSIEFPANIPNAQQEQYVRDLLKENYPINFIQFSPNTVTPKGINEGWKGAEHMYSFDYAYQIKVVRDWLFKQKKN